MKRTLSYLLLAGCTFGVMSISRYVHETNFCTEYDDLRVYQEVMSRFSKTSWQKANLKGAVNARTAAYSARVATCLMPFDNFNVSILR